MDGVAGWIVVLHFSFRVAVFFGFDEGRMVGSVAGRRPWGSCGPGSLGLHAHFSLTGGRLAGEWQVSQS